MKMLAFCNNCNSVFLNEMGISIPNTATGISFVGTIVGPCSFCGGEGRIPDGVYDFINGTLSLLTAIKPTLSELQTLSETLKKFSKKAVTPEEIADEIQNKSPNFSPLKILLPKTTQDIYAFISILLAIVAIFLSLSSNNDDKEKVDVVQVFNYIEQTNLIETKNNQIFTNSKTGRNEMCPCDSGIKFKHCHGNHLN
jgi:hypothetical protein